MMASVVASAATTVALFCGLTVAEHRGALDFLRGGAEEVGVPSIVGVTVEQARDILRSRDLLLTLQAERPHPEIGSGKVAGQAPLAGSRTRRGATVQALLSSGPEQVAVPNVSGTRPDDAAQQLTAQKLVPGARVEQPSSTVAAGMVVGTDPLAGKLVSHGTSVRLLVSTGPAQKTVPKVVGLRLSRAKKVLEAEGFRVGSSRYGYSDRHDPDVVIKQDPEADVQVAPGTEVRLTINES